MTEDITMDNGDFLHHYPEVSRIEVVSRYKRELVRHDCANVQVTLQDDGKTIKVFYD